MTDPQSDNSALSQNVARVGTSPTFAVLNQVSELRAAGKSITDLGPGELDFLAPSAAAEAGIQAIREGRTRYTTVEGIPALRERIAALASADVRDDHIIRADQVVVTTGSKQALFNACFTLFGPGDEVLVPIPAWPSYTEIIRLARAEPVPVTGTPENHFKVTAELLEHAASSRTRGVILNSPCNPTGAVYTSEEVQAISSLARRHGWWIITDEIYRALSYEAPAPSLLSVTEPDDRLVVIGGIAKAFAMTGWRLGWAIAPKPIARAMTTLQSHVTSNATTISQHAALAALSLESAEIEQQRMVSVLRTRRECAMQLLSAVGARFIHPAGAFYIFMRTPSDVPGASVAFARALLADAGVAVVPGVAFGTEGWVRASYGVSEDAILRGFGHVADALRQAQG